MNHSVHMAAVTQVRYLHRRSRPVVRGGNRQGLTSPISGQSMTPGQARRQGRMSHWDSNLTFRDGINTGAVRLRARA